MTTTYPSHPNLDGNYAPLRMECDLNDLVVEGEVPQDLFGSYYRNGPDPQFPPKRWALSLVWWRWNDSCLPV